MGVWVVQEAYNGQFQVMPQDAEQCPECEGGGSYILPLETLPEVPCSDCLGTGIVPCLEVIQ